MGKHKPATLPADILNDIDMDCSGKRYLRSEMFSRWLTALDHDMHEQGRSIALLIDSTPGHGNAENLGLTNITIIRLPPNTTSLTAPGCWCHSACHGHFSKEMLQVISRMNRWSQAVVRTIQNAKLWTCSASSWRSRLVAYATALSRRQP